MGSGPLRLDLVTETWPPEVNGVAMTLSRLVGGLRGRGHEVTVVRPRQAHERGRAGRRSRDHLRPGSPIPRYPGLRFGWPSGGALRRRWRRRRPHLVHVATEGPLGLSALGVARAMRITVTSSFHTNFHSYGRHYGYGAVADGVRRYLRWFHNRTRVTMVPSEGARETLAADGFANCRVMERGVDTALFAPSRRREDLRATFGARPQDLVLIVVGRLAREKNLALALRAFEAVRAARPDARLLFVGEGPHRADVEGRSGVHLAGLRLGEDLAAHYASGDLFLFPSTTETFGNVFCEAMASGLACVAFDYAAAAAHAVHGDDALKAPYADEEAFVRAAVRAAEDAALRERLGTAARRRMLAVGWDRVVLRFEAEAHAALGAGGRG